MPPLEPSERVRKRWEAEDQRLDEVKKADRERLKETPNQTRLDVKEPRLAYGIPWTRGKTLRLKKP